MSESAKSEKLGWIIGLAVAFLFGGGATILGYELRFEKSGVDWLLDRLVNEKTYHIAVVYDVEVGDDGTVTSCTVRDMSATARRFFDVHAESDVLIDRSSTEVLARLKGVVSDLNHERLLKDHDRILGDFTAGYHAVADVPVQFNFEHTHKEFHGRTYLPVIVSFRESYGRFSNASKNSHICTVIYMEQDVNMVNGYGYEPVSGRFLLTLNRRPVEDVPSSKRLVFAFLDKTDDDADLTWRENTLVDLIEPDLTFTAGADELEVIVTCPKLKDSIKMGEWAVCRIYAVPKDLALERMGSVAELEEQDGVYFIDGCANRARPSISIPGGLQMYFEALGAEEQAVIRSEMERLLATTPEQLQSQNEGQGHSQ